MIGKLVQKLKARLRARKVRNSTLREIELEKQLKMAKAAAEAYKGHFETLQKDFRALFDDHLELRQRYSDVVFARCEDARIGRFAEDVRQGGQRPEGEGNAMAPADPGARRTRAVASASWGHA